ncbi:hypothetical protein SSP24_04030 [Streptomyces spinoverrucosus]|uniref:Uncharacterized protein n=1 Tax=Streptomyces spinoverrucosus TaxID=284043 RepID=A0A4Y3V9G6_9ACTN|nr:hypothetical protein [Streptomyces spinoverrucosus]GEC02748.1 hypothetical protein SSP24_04030 [Streptomyces spinoverrucosus]GHB40746.1 hypothetical protein GCM10010397_08570 [Streptomyces spinoverrucosus]
MSGNDVVSQAAGAFQTAVEALAGVGPGAEITDLAAAHGLATLTAQPFMLLQLDDEYETFAAVLGAAFGAPPAVITSLYTPVVLG